MATPAGIVEEARRFARRAVGAWQRWRATTRPAPDPTGFYAAGDPGDGPRGQVLATEEIAAPAGARAWRVRFRTLDAGGRPVAASMAVAAPTADGPWPRPVVAWVHGAVGVAPGCGPSRRGFEAWYGDRLLRHGAVVIAPDLTGLGVDGVAHPYLHGTTAARSVLDAARAAAAIPATGAGAVLALAGHSAGGHAVLWASELAATDEGAGLDVRLAVALSPIGDLATAMRRYATVPGMAAFPVQLAATWSPVEPVEAAEALTPAALARLDALATMDLAGLLQVFRGDPARWVRPGAFTDDRWSAALDRQSAGRRPGAAPVVLVHGEADSAIDVAWTRSLAAAMDAAGCDVTLRTYDVADHNTIHDAAADDVVGALLAAVRAG